METTTTTLSNVAHDDAAAAAASAMTVLLSASAAAGKQIMLVGPQMSYRTVAEACAIASVSASEAHGVDVVVWPGEFTITDIVDIAPYVHVRPLVAPTTWDSVGDTAQYSVSIIVNGKGGFRLARNSKMSNFHIRYSGTPDSDSIDNCCLFPELVGNLYHCFIDTRA